MKCPHCGTVHGDPVKFCTNCGEALTPTHTSTAEESAGPTDQFSTEALLKIRASSLKANALGWFELIPSLPGIPFKSVQVEMRSMVFDQPISAVIPLAPKSLERRRRFQVKPHSSGHALVEFQFTCTDQEDVPYVYEGEWDITIQGVEAAERQIIQKIEIKAEKVTAADFSGTFGPVPWEQTTPGIENEIAEIPLYLNEAATHTLREQRRKERLLTCPYCTRDTDRSTTFCPQCDNELPTYLRKKRSSFAVDLTHHLPCFSAKLVSQTPRKEVYIFTKRVVTLGREKSNDIVLRLTPPTAENIQKSLRISRQHARLVWEGENICLQTFKPTFIAGRAVKAVVLEDGMMIDIAGVLTLQIALFWSKRAKSKDTDASPVSLSELKTVSDETAMGGTQSLSSAVLLAARLQRFDDTASKEEYLLLRREATIGTSPENPLVLNGSLDQYHARLILLDNQLWVEDLGSRYGSFVNNRRIGRDEIELLVENSEIRLGDILLHRL